MTTTTTHSRESLLAAFYAAGSTEGRTAVARQIGELDAQRTDSGECDCSDATCKACEARLDSAEPSEERTDAMTHDPEAAARAAMNRTYATAWTKPLGSGLADEVPRAPSLEEQGRIDQAERKHDERARFDADFERDREARADVAEDNLEDDAETKARKRAQCRAENAWREPLNLQDRKQLEIARLARETDDEVA